MLLSVDNATNYELGAEFLAKLEEIYCFILDDLGISKKSVEFLLVENEKIKALNAEFRGVDKATDVLSFPLELEFSPFLGSVVISLDFAREISVNLKHSLESEIALLFVHGVLHLAGFDHECDDGEHREKERQIVEKFNLPHSLIIRTQG
ncbi:MAG: rRNA maturation RNase YbeY [Helicobacter sp.]|nr:rRNA maturation RNase YbeY [Helicobacteraceae bacterium]MDY3113919.1 rRNA maturation RNase YbeY [Helicobacter sp.]